MKTMRIWALGDLHLPSTRQKTMAIFGPRWENHQEKIERNWRRAVEPDDIVLIPGDTSWAMRLEEAADDLRWLGSLPGRYKILIRGNHDYWWATKQKLRDAAPPEFLFIHNDAVAAPPFTFAGTRGWELPDPEQTEEENAVRQRLCQREAERLRRSLEHARSLEGDRLVVLMHFPPILPDQERQTPFAGILDDVEPEVVVFGHVHGDYGDAAFQGVRVQTRYILVSADAADFKPVFVAQA